jgi:hypothetical protein
MYKAASGGVVIIGRCACDTEQVEYVCTTRTQNQQRLILGGIAGYGFSNRNNPVGYRITSVSLSQPLVVYTNSLELGCD